MEATGERAAQLGLPGLAFTTIGPATGFSHNDIPQ
jgi:hypothetical protein